VPCGKNSNGYLGDSMAENLFSGSIWLILPSSRIIKSEWFFWNILLSASDLLDFYVLGDCLSALASSRNMTGCGEDVLTPVPDRNQVTRIILWNAGSTVTWLFLEMRTSTVDSKVLLSRGKKVKIRITRLVESRSALQKLKYNTNKSIYCSLWPYIPR
jgi:hypothetical protein